MVGRISPPTPDPDTHQHCSETLRTARYPLFFPHEPNNSPRHLHHAAPIFLLISAVSVNFPSPRRCTCTLHHSRRSDVRTCKCANSFVYKSLPPLCPLFRALALCFQWFAASFWKTPGVGGMPVNSPHLKSMTSRRFSLPPAPLSGPVDVKALPTIHCSLPTLPWSRTLC